MRTWPLALVALVLSASGLVACGGGDSAPAAEDGTVAARVGDAVLTEGELSEALGSFPVLDSASARRQIVEQWVRRELVVQEARRAGLDEDPDVQRELRESEAAVLEAAYLARFFASADAEPTEPEIESYYETNAERLRLTEPYVRVRLIHATNGARAQEAANALEQLQGTPLADSLFSLAAREYAADPEGAIALADVYLPESRLLALDSDLGQRVSTLPAGASPATVVSPEAAYAVAVVDRVQPGRTPSLGMVRSEIVERLAIRKRKGAEARHIARLRSEAEAAGRLD